MEKTEDVTISKFLTLGQKLVLDKAVEFEYCDTNSQIADLFTKALDEQKFNYFASKIMNQPPVPGEKKQKITAVCKLQKVKDGTEIYH